MTAYYVKWTPEDSRALRARNRRLRDSLHINPIRSDALYMDLRLHA